MWEPRIDGTGGVESRPGVRVSGPWLVVRTGAGPGRGEGGWAAQLDAGQGRVPGYGRQGHQGGTGKAGRLKDEVHL